MKLHTVIASVAFALAIAGPAYAASDYLLEIEGVKGESAAPAAVDSWSFGVCNAGQCSGSASIQHTIVSPRDSASGLATGKTAPKTKPSAASWDLATNKGARSAGGGDAGGHVHVAAGDVDGDGRSDLAFAATQPEVASLTLTFRKIEFTYRAVCDGKHFDKAVLRSAADSFELTDVTVTCTLPAGAGAARIDQTPARISTNVTVPKQTQGATFGERCAAGTCDALTDGVIVIRFTGGQMKHTKTGHVTLLK